jgi:hypothetical protein
MRRKILLPLALFAPLVLQACADTQTGAANNAAASPTATPAAAQAQPTAARQQQVVTATVEDAKLDAGGAGEANITLDIADGYHVNANPASDKFYVATEVQAAAQEGITPGKPAYPSAVSRKLSFSDKPLSVYEGRAVIKLPLRADKTAAKGQHTFHVTVRVQPCNDQACQPPRSIEAFIPVTVN